MIAAAAAAASLLLSCLCAASALAAHAPRPSARTGASGHARTARESRHAGRRGHRGHRARSAGSAPPVTISPLPGTPEASPHTQISFLGAPANQIAAVTVTGSATGRHSGKLESYDSAEGASFLPLKPFRQGEHVTVTAMVGPPGHQQQVHTDFTIAHHFRYYRFPKREAHTAATSGPNVQSFPSDPSIHPTAVTVNASSPAANPGDVFFAFNGGEAQWGPTIINGQGQLVWFHPVPGADHAMDFKVAEYKGEKVLVWWQGKIPPIGVGFGVDEIYNEHYEQVAQVRAGNGYFSDLHEFLITPQGQAWTTAYSLVEANLTSMHGSPHGGLVDPLVQEIDIKTGLVMFEWQAYGHVPLTNSYSKPSKNPHWPFDYFHVNSISLDPWGDGNFLISSRNTWAGYEVNHSNGKVMWTLGGKKSTFKMGPHTQTAYQHDIQWHPNHTITIFDDGSSPQVHHQSRVLHEKINWSERTVELISDDFHAPALVANSQGNDQLLSNGASFVGWGAQPDMTEFGPHGKTLFNAQLPSGQSYRAYRFPWKGMPNTRPSLTATSTGAGQVVLHASWNGATDVSSWRVWGWQAGKHASTLNTTQSAGFETQISLKSADTWFSAQALGPAGEVLASSKAAKAG